MVVVVVAAAAVGELADLFFSHTTSLRYMIDHTAVPTISMEIRG